MTGLAATSSAEPLPSPGPGAPAPVPRTWILLDGLVRAAGAVVAFAGGVLFALIALLVVPLRIDLGVVATRLPLAVVVAVAGNALLLWFARRATGAKWGVLAPTVGWFLLMLPSLGVGSDGSRLMMPNDWVGLLTIFGGTITLTIGLVLTIAAPAGPGAVPRRAVG